MHVTLNSKNICEVKTCYSFNVSLNYSTTHCVNKMQQHSKGWEGGQIYVHVWATTYRLYIITLHLLAYIY